ncbi:pVI [Titi monkey adenovirus ECC-2011]|uniref:Pre-protein VI n=1 Tax=titi monkey adenovirus 1 TaxID=3123084 RepID=G0ZAI4_9ADEN|nr:pVI [Titi monkey adenovirus ECC-2011]AEK98455.1 pVI [Titi monkey adenovirus ECC-2011]
MEDINFSSLAPRQGSRPLMGAWGEIGTNQMNGGAFNWGSIWSGLKSFGSTVKNYGSKAWNSTTGQMLRDKLKDTGVREKIVEGVTSGIHGALDLARQEMEKHINSRLDHPRPDVEVEEMLPGLNEKPPLAPSAPPKEDRLPEKRPRPEAEEELVIRTDEKPPSYEEIFGKDMAPPPPVASTYPMTKPIAPLARPVIGTSSSNKKVPPPRPPPPTRRPTVPAVAPAGPVDVPVTLDLPPPPSAVVTPAAPPVAIATPATPAARPSYSRPSRQSWQSTLSSITGLGVRSLKRRRCY